MPTRPHALTGAAFLAALASLATAPFARAGEIEDMEGALAHLKLEPDIRRTQAAALRFFRIDPDTVNSMRSRAGLKALLPTVGIKIRTNTSSIDLDKFDFIQFPGQRAGLDEGKGTLTEYEIAGSWDLGRLLFNPEVLDVSSLVVLQESVLKEITRLYYTRRRLQVDLVLSPPGDPATKISKELRIEELTGTLNAMTGNLFATASGGP